MSNVIIMKCDCESSFQDSEYGKGMRLHNTSGAKGKKSAYCTVCAPMSSNKFLADVPKSPQFGMTVAVVGRKSRKEKSYQ